MSDPGTVKKPKEALIASTMTPKKMAGVDVEYEGKVYKILVGTKYTNTYKA
jgi:hypothetical protein